MLFLVIYPTQTISFSKFPHPNLLLPRRCGVDAKRAVIITLSEGDGEKGGEEKLNHKETGRG